MEAVTNGRSAGSSVKIAAIAEPSIMRDDSRALQERSAGGLVRRSAGGLFLMKLSLSINYDDALGGCSQHTSKRATPGQTLP